MEYDPARRQSVSSRLDNTLRVEIGVTTYDVPAPEWQALASGGPLRLGYTAPVLVDGEIHCGYSSDIITAGTLWLDDAGVSAYLDIVEYLLTRELSRLAANPDAEPDELRKGAEDDLLDLQHDALRWLTQIQMHILDRSLGTASHPT